MSDDYATIQDGLQAAPDMAQRLRQRLAQFLAPLLAELDAKMDVRLVRTFLSTLQALITFRHSTYGLLLSELGGYLLGPQQAPAGTKRLSNLLRSQNWRAALIEGFLWRQAEAGRQALEQAAEQAYLVWDESVLEKPESRKLAGLCPVRSSKAARCLKVKPGYWHPPTTKPIFVPGMHWLSLLLLGPSATPLVVSMRWWSSDDKAATRLRQLQTSLLTRCAHVWGRQVVHLFDRGYAGTNWLGQLLGRNLRFIVRWPKRYYLNDSQGRAQNAWKLARGRKSLDHRQVWDAKKQTYRTMGVFFRAVQHPDYPSGLWLVVCRVGKGKPPWYLLTNEIIETVEDAWQVVFAYARRWQVEMAFRYNKSELALQSPRLWSWERRIKLLLMATLAYAFLLSLLSAFLKPICDWLLRHFCHRTGKRSREVSAPLYRLRAALSRLWLAYPGFASQNSG